MEWRSLKVLVASVVSLAVVSQVARAVYKKFVPEKRTETNANTDQVCVPKNHEINDVLMFSDNMTYHYITPAPNANSKLCVTKSRQNSYKLLKYLKCAQQTLDVCMYLITSNEIAESIIRLGRQHVMVRVIVDGEMAYSGGSQVKWMKEYSFIKVQCSKTSHLMHHKFCIVDGPMAIERKRKLVERAERMQLNACDAGSVSTRRWKKTAKGFVMSGSLNWSTQALSGSCDNVIVTSQPHVVNKFEKEFENLWQETESSLPAIIIEE